MLAETSNPDHSLQCTGLRFALNMNRDSKPEAFLLNPGFGFGKPQNPGFGSGLGKWRLYISTRSQAVARIADRTAKNCKGHVT